MGPRPDFFSSLLVLPYWIMFLFPALVAINSRPLRAINADGTRRVRVEAVWLGIILLLSLLIGLRFEVGGDWFNYFRWLLRGSFLSVADLPGEQDPGYMFLNIMSSWLGWGISGVNLFAGLIFSIGLAVFCRSLPRPWLALACAVPYLVIVVAMGYTRQSAALGLVMVALVTLRRGKALQFAAWLFLAALFHKSAVLVVPIALLTSRRRRLQSFGAVGILGFAAYDALLADHAADLVDVYITNERLESQGALIRLGMNLVAALVFLTLGHRFIMASSENRLWRIMSWGALAMFVALMSTGFTTALDRIALYLIPLQLVVFSHLPDALGRPHGRNSAIVFGILIYFAAVQFVWLNYANNARFWLPYQMGLSLNGW
jgi:hypothetical protein